MSASVSNRAFSVVAGWLTSIHSPDDTSASTTDDVLVVEPSASILFGFLKISLLISRII